LSPTLQFFLTQEDMSEYNLNFHFMLNLRLIQNDTSLITSVEHTVYLDLKQSSEITLRVIKD